MNDHAASGDPRGPGNQHVLVVDDEPQMLGVYRTCLTTHGYRVTAVSDGSTALDVASVDRPDAVVLDLVMPGMGGLEVLDRLRRTPTTAHIPVLMVTGRLNPEDRAEGLRRGVDDFIHKPFRYDELLSRVAGLLRRRDKAEPEPREIEHPQDDRRIQILRQAAAGGPDALVPVYDPSSPSGFRYPATDGLDDSPDAGDPIDDLDFLRRRNYLERRFHDTVISCPFCTHHDLHVREVCPACGSADLRALEMIHHFRCSFVGPIDDFRRGDKLVCPKCRGVLRHIGLDHDKPTDTVQCASCNSGFQEPDVATRCRSCSRPFPPEQAQRRRIYAYSLTAAGRFAAEVGSFMHAAVGPDFLEEDLQVYRPEFFREIVSHEVARGTSLGHSTAVLRIGVRGLDRVAERRGRVASHRTLLEVARLVRNMTRSVDKVGRLHPTEFLVLLPGGDTRGAVALARRISVAFDRLRHDTLEDIALSYAWAVHPHEVADASELIERVLREVADADLTVAGEVDDVRPVETQGRRSTDTIDGPPPTQAPEPVSPLEEPVVVVPPPPVVEAPAPPPPPPPPPARPAPPPAPATVESAEPSWWDDDEGDDT